MVDIDRFYEIVERGSDLAQQNTQRNTMFDAMEKMYLMVWDDEAKVQSQMRNVKTTRSPDARNALIGAMRLLVATDPKFEVAREQNDLKLEQVADKLERAANQIWQQAGRRQGQPRHYDVVLSALLFGEVHIGVTKTDDLVKYMGSKGTAAKNRAEAIAKDAPYLFDVWDPRTGYPEFDEYGLVSYYREVTTTAGRVMDWFGKEKVDNRNRTDEVVLCHWWDYETRATWVQGKTEPLVFEPHGLDFIPVVVHFTEGTRMLEEYPEYQRQPFLYTLWKSGLWERQNLALTVLYTMTFGIGANPLYIYQSPGKKELTIDYSVPGGVALIDAGDSLAPLAKQVIDPSIMVGLEIAERKLEASTIYGQTLGEPLGANAPFSMVSLLHQAGRLPLVSAQRKASWAIADAVKMALEWYKKEPWEEGQYSGYIGELMAEEVPTRFELEASLDISLPQDKLQMMNTAAMATQAGLTSRKYARETYLDIGQSDDMQREIWSETAAELYFQKFQQELEFAQQQAMAAAQQAMQPPMPGPPEPGMQPGLEGLPPEMGQGGGQPPEVPGVPPGLAPTQPIPGPRVSPTEINR